MEGLLFNLEIKMKKYYCWIALVFVSLQSMASDNNWTVSSPDQGITLHIQLNEKTLSYQVSYHNKIVIKPSSLGFSFKGMPNLQADLQVLGLTNRTQNVHWQPVWGQRSDIVDNFNELCISLQERHALQRKISVIFRAYDDGVAFRYHIPEQVNLKEFVITDELTQFSFAKSYSTWWIPAYRNQRYEYQYLHSALSSVDVAHTPITLIGDDVALAVHEAALTNYASMTLKNIDDNNITFTSDLVPWADGAKVYAKTPLTTPWRTIQIANNEVELLNSDLILNLNEPAAEGFDTSYIKPGKYMGIWWEMHIGNKNWSPGPDQGATTERAMQYIDFAAKHNIDGVLVEGWNKGWEGEWWHREPTFDFTTPVQGFDMDKVSQYALNKGIRLIGHHETAAGITRYEKQMEDAFDYYEKRGVQAVKMGYVGTRLEHGEQKEWHHGQYMVEHTQKVVASAAKHHIMINAHETIKDTGLSRTYPNFMTREAVRGMEYNGGSPDQGNLPNHTLIIPFTRGLAGPTDFTPGIFNFNYQQHRPNNRVPTTLAKQLALYVTLYSPLQMAADLPENYEGHPAFQFIDDVPTDWQKSVALQGKIGEFLVIARQDKYSDSWYLGATTNEKARDIRLSLDFLDPSTQYMLTLYLDGKDAHWQNNPMSYEIKTRHAVSTDSLTIHLQAGGGAAIKIDKL
jgi:alpha-glucosidase